MRVLPGGAGRLKVPGQWRRCHLLLVLQVACLCACSSTAQEGASAGAAHVPGAAEDPPAAVASLDALIDSLHVPPSALHFKVVKCERRFHVLAGDTVLRTYPCVLGERPVGDKQYEGDRRTPEGIFTFRSKRVHPEWHRFIWVDYPNAESWRRYRRRQAAGLVPAGRAIGGEIGIHGVPEGMDHWITDGTDWTWGCIALRNADLDEIYPIITPGLTWMEVVP